MQVRVVLQLLRAYMYVSSKQCPLECRGYQSSVMVSLSAATLHCTMVMLNHLSPFACYN